MWSHYAGSGPATKVVRVGALDDPDACPPQAHVFVQPMQPWVHIPPGVPQFPEYYKLAEVWTRASVERRLALLPQIDAWLAIRAKV